MNRRGIVLQTFIFSVQWGLMLAGFAILKELATQKIFESNFPEGEYFDATVKAFFALSLAVVWLFLWDRQVRFLFFRSQGKPS